MIELLEGFWVDPFEVKIVKAIDERSCLLFVTGEGAMDGHVLDYPAEEVVDAVIEARNETEEISGSPENDKEDQKEE